MDVLSMIWLFRENFAICKKKFSTTVENFLVHT